MDQKLLFLINREWTSSGLDRLMAVMSSAAFWTVPLVIAGVFALWMGGFRARAFVLVALLAFGFSDGVVGRILKRAVGRLRPHQTEVGVRMVDLASPAYSGVLQPPKVKVSLGTGRDQPGRSFPSNHASNTAAIALLAACFFRRWGWLALIPASLVSYSRVYVGSHWPSDALGGMCLGFAVAFFTLALAEISWRRLAPRIWPDAAKRHPSLLPA
jgi:membrane-associated phospholipid phosphatase